jgi:glycerophosphoryl diester phosphodiesterase
VSATCASGLVAIGTAYALLKANLAEQAIAGASDSALTPFTMAQLKAAKVLAKAPSLLFPLRPMHPERSGMVASEGAACIALQTAQAMRQGGSVPLARVLGYGAASEATTATGITDRGDALVMAMRRALQVAKLEPGDIDLLVGQKPAFSQVDFGSPNGLVQRAHALGFSVCTWTARAEEALYSPEEYFQHFVNTGADGIFADHPDLLKSFITHGN